MLVQGGYSSLLLVLEGHISLGLGLRKRGLWAHRQGQAPHTLVLLVHTLVLVHHTLVMSMC